LIFAEMAYSMGVRRGGAKRAFASPLRNKNFWKTWNQEFNSDYLG